MTARKRLATAVLLVLAFVAFGVGRLVADQPPEESDEFEEVPIRG